VLHLLGKRRHRYVAASLAAALVIVYTAWGAGSALAAFPGRDGVIAFTRTDAFKNQTVWSVDPRTGQQTRLTTVPARCQRLRQSWVDEVPSFSVSGRYLYYSHSGDCDRSMPEGLYRIRLGGSPPQLMVRDTGGLVTWWPAPTAGGKRLLLINDLPISPRRDPDEFQDRIYSAPLAGGGRPGSLSPRGATSDEFPAVSATGRVAFSRDHHRLVVGRVGARLRRGLHVVASIPRGTFASSDWSPRGERIVFERQPGGRFHSDVYVVSARGGAVRRLTRTRDAVSPVWSPSGRWIAFSRSPNKHPRQGPLYIIRPNGRQLRKLLGQIDETRLSWQPR
jgi:Tol biopolymer transport system component